MMMMNVVSRAFRRCVPRALPVAARHLGARANSGAALGMASSAAQGNSFTVLDGQLQPGLPADEFRFRRNQLVESLPDNSALIVNAASTKYMTHDIPYEFRQNSNFMYLTGLEEPDAVAVFLKTQKKTSFILFVLPRDAHSEQWDGARVGLDGAKLTYGADDAFQLGEMEQQLTKILTGLQQIYVMDPAPGVYAPSFLKATASFHSKFYAGNFFVEQLRVVKSENELNRMRFAGDIAVGGFFEMMRRTRPHMTELALAAEFEAHCKRNGALWLSFPCVVGTGANAAVIHYLSKRNLLQPNDLLLVDSGCEVPGYYVSDITRTWPVTSSAALSPAQKDLYEFTLDIQKQSLLHLETQLAAGQAISLDQLHAFASRLMTDGLRKFGILGPNSTMRDLHRYNPTHIGHYLGMDVHDTPNISRSVPLRPGMVITVEPGVYLPKNDRNLLEEFRGIGIRIEDDVIIKNKGIEVATARIPKELDDMDALRSV